MILRLTSKFYCCRLAITAGIVLCYAALAAQKNASFSFNDLRFENFNATNRFTNQYIQCLTLDSAGYVWAGANGLLRFDGVNVTYYNSFKNERHRLADDYIDELCVDRKGRMWVGSGRGLQYYDEALNTFVSPGLSKGATRPEFAFRQKLDGDTLWFYSQAGLQGVDLNSNLVFNTNVTDLFEPTVTAVINDSILWLHSATSGSVYYNKKNGIIKRHHFFSAEKSVRIWSVEQIGNDFYVGTTSGLFTQKGLFGEVKMLEEFDGLHITQLLKMPGSGGGYKLWIATFNQGLFLFDALQKEQSRVFTSNQLNLFRNTSGKINRRMQQNT